ncbi:MAG TPA: AI-2E family transporter [Ramlibacter sp.]|nr:AI-2E family transporter [Ramlibacter sp.]
MNTNAPAIGVARDDLEWPEPLRQRAVAFALGALLLVLWLHLFAALFGALAGYVLLWLIRKPRTKQIPARRRIANRLLALALVSGGVIALVEGFHLLLNASADGLPRLLQLLADTIDHIRTIAPDWIATRLPESADEIQRALSGWLRSHAHDMQQWGRDALRIALHLVIGVVIGVMASISIHRRPATAALPSLAIERWRQLARAFRDVLAAQLRIALVNAGLTAVYLLLVLPAFDVHVPLAMTLVAFTFFASLLPIIGNLMSNTAIVVAALTVSMWVGFASFIFLIAIHKLEYFLNAHFVGSRVDLPVYALLATMLLLEAAFGMAGMVAAPIYCAWLTRELRVNGWIGP